MVSLALELRVTKDACAPAQVGLRTVDCPVVSHEDPFDVSNVWRVGCPEDVTDGRAARLYIGGRRRSL